MAVNKLHREFEAVDLDSGWEVPPGYPPGMQQKILSGSLDEANMTGTRTRLLRFQPGTFTTEPFVHTYWEEVYQLSGDLSVGKENPERFTAHTYAVRPPGVPHGPFSSEDGCLLLETHYFDPA